MLIKSIYLKGFKPLALANIESIYIDVISDLVLILGSNGCGKSSLLRELNPFPANPADYRDDGMKVITIEHNNSIYELSSILKRGAKHTVIKDGIEIHSNVISSLQREYVIKEFNYTPLINKLLIGDLKFTSMTPQARRELLTIISPLDLNYVIKVHGTVKEELRDNLAITKHLVSKSGDARTKLRELNIDDGMEAKKIEIENRINLLLPYASRLIDNENSNIEYEIDNNYNKLLTIKQKLDRFDNRRIPIDGITNVEELTEYIGTLSGQLSATQTNINNISTDIQSINELSNSLSDNTMTPDSINNRLEFLYSELDNYKNDYGIIDNHKILLDINTYLLSELDSVYDWLANSRVYDEEDENKYVQSYQNILSEIANLKQTINKDAVELKHLHNPDAIFNCPKCKFSFNIKGLSVEDNIKLINERITNNYNRLIIVEKERDDLEPIINDINLVSKIIYKVISIKRSTTLLSNIWEELGSEKNILRNSTQVRNILSKHKSAVVSSLKRKELLSEIDTHKKTLALQHKYGDGLGVRLTNLHISLESELYVLRKLEKDIEYSKNLLKYINYFNKLEDSSNQILSELESNFKTAIDKAIKLDARTQCDLLYNELALNTGILNKYNSLITAINEMEKEYEKITERQSYLSILEEHLSHNKGLIADQMLGFIGSYIEQINLICKEIWEYRLELKMCHMDNGQLDYTFPLIVENEIVSDIKEGSTAQTDIIDFAFVMVMRQYLNINDYPLFLDELGSSFDTIHRRKLMDYLKSIQGTNVASQMFLINHYSTLYGGLVNNDTIVLDHRNVPVPSNANENTKITYRGE